jgi:hypothetical protein
MELDGVTYVGPPVDDAEVLAIVPAGLRDLLAQVNGFVAYRGGLHVRGACREPAWHALREVWLGPRALHRRYDALGADDVPFAQDAVGDQWLLRDEEVIRLAAESGEVDALGMSLGGFLLAAQSDPVETLGLHPLLRFQEDGGSLAPGQLLLAHPPFATKEAAAGVRLGAVPAAEALDFHAQLAGMGLAPGDRVRFVVGD